MFSLGPRRFAGLVATSTKAQARIMSTANATRQVVSKEERALRRAARKERANAYMSSIGSGAAVNGSTATVGTKTTTSGGASSGGLPFDASRLGWYAAVLIPTAFIAWGVYDEDSPPAKLSRFIGLADRFEEFAKPARTKLLPDWSQVCL
jgi:hypothetical protein